MAGLLLLLVIAGIRAAGPAVGGQGPWRQHALIIGIALEVALAALLIGLAIRGRPRRQQIRCPRSCAGTCAGPQSP